ncbi:MOSC domain-containing protein [Deinococcus sp. HMF7620]|uniref:MOSC domain-containing protein n=1 Tax=Deinococcus arboris TaxID=2682977 RepID=A0A7C9LMJ1_9DEIO|nr:MOSC domain-containing protein [Deinococcus arboris]MVN88258.1 MOSC domain-containing protein [Deinococcus arboris]
MTGARVKQVCVGLPAPLSYRGSTVPSGFVKTPVNWPLWLGEEGLDGDGQADRRYHGGPDKAVCVYPSEHYPFWSGRLIRPLGPAAFGENFTTAGLTETNVCIGDIVKVGGAVVEVSQPRQPCFKLAARHDEPRLTLWVQESGLTGWYFRVLRPGAVRAGSRMSLVTRPPEAVSVQEANRVMHVDKQDQAGIQRLLAQDALSTSWRATLEKRLARHLEDTAARLTGVHDPV